MPVSKPYSFSRWFGPFLVAAVVAVCCGWNLYFLCDDAFINYRFSGNAYDGNGFVWNPAPFAPVEGYTSPAWVFGLWLVWELTGVQPPVASVPITFVCGLGILWIVGRRVGALVLPERSARWGPVVTAVTLVAIASNHTFATWLSSGMETSLFVLLALLWTLRATQVGGARGTGLLLLAVWAVLSYLTRPDGILLVFGTIVIGGHSWLRKERGFWSMAAALTPVVVPVLHVFWRHSYYGEWLPNTYYAKVTEAWPESGLRYVFCYVLEHGVWLWLPLAVVWLLVSACRRGAIASLFAERWPALVAVGAWLGFAGYYSLVVGGDHFAYRIFLQFVPLMFLSAAAMAASLRLSGPIIASGIVVLAVVGNVPGWWLEAQLVGRETEGFARTASRGPAVLRPLLEVYDHHQAWLFLHSVGFRRAFHAEMCRLARVDLPERRSGYVAGAAGQRLIYRADAIGVSGWALSDVAILDGHGLCDWVIARVSKPVVSAPKPAEVRSAFALFDKDQDGRLQASEIAAGAQWLRSIGPQSRDDIWPELMLSLGDRDGDDCLGPDELVDAILAVVPPRQMAHERAPPEGYIDEFRPNVERRDGSLHVLPDVKPLGDEEIRAIEQEYRERFGR